MWEIDKLVMPVRKTTSLPNADLKRYNSDHYGYIFDWTIPAGGAPQPARQVQFTGLVDESSDFFITNIMFSFGRAGTFSDLAVDRDEGGLLTVRDNTTLYQLVEGIDLLAFYKYPGIPSNIPSGERDYFAYKAQQTIWPMSYGIGAGGSFSVYVDIPAQGIRAFATECNIYVEGFKYYDIGGAI